MFLLHLNLVILKGMWWSSWPKLSTQLNISFSFFFFTRFNARFGYFLAYPPNHAFQQVSFLLCLRFAGSPCVLERVVTTLCGDWAVCPSVFMWRWGLRGVDSECAFCAHALGAFSLSSPPWCCVWMNGCVRKSWDCEFEFWKFKIPWEFFYLFSTTQIWQTSSKLIWIFLKEGKTRFRRYLSRKLLFSNSYKHFIRYALYTVLIIE